MRKLHRLPLSAKTLAFLMKRTHQVRSVPSARLEAMRLWGLRDNAAFREVRQTLESMASGLSRCMYCEDGAGTDIEHFWPKSSWPERAFDGSNYLLACSECNSNYKRDLFPRDAAGAPLLLDPTVDEPREHLDFSPRTGRYTHRTEKGAQSIEAFGLRRDVLEKGRQDAWISIDALLVRYGHVCERQDWRMARDIQRSLCRHPFASVLDRFLHVASGAQASRYITRECQEVLRKHPDILGWL